MLVEALLIAAISSSRSYSSPSRSYSSPSRSYSSPKSSAPKSSTPKTSTPKSSMKVNGKSVSTAKVGKSALKSNTPAPKPHSYRGTTYTPSAAQYTNTNGMWIWFWLWYTTQDGKKEVRCYDEKHERQTCNRDDKSWQRDW